MVRDRKGGPGTISCTTKVNGALLSLQHTANDVEFQCSCQHLCGLAAFRVSSPGLDEGQEGRPRFQQLHHKGEWHFAVPVTQRPLSHNCCCVGEIPRICSNRCHSSGPGKGRDLPVRHQSHKAWWTAPGCFSTADNWCWKSTVQI